MHWALQKFTEVQIGQTKKYPIEKFPTPRALSFEKTLG